MLFNFPCFIINGTIKNLYINYIDYALSWHIKHAENKVWGVANIKSCDNGHETKLGNDVYGLQITRCNGPIFYLRNHVYSTIL